MLPLCSLAKLKADAHTAQVVEVLEPDARNMRLLELLARYHASRRNRVLVFVLYKKEAPQVESMLSRKGWKARMGIGLPREQPGAMLHACLQCILETAVHLALHRGCQRLWMLLNVIMC